MKHEENLDDPNVYHSYSLTDLYDTSNQSQMDLMKNSLLMNFSPTSKYDKMKSKRRIEVW